MLREGAVYRYGRGGRDGMNNFSGAGRRTSVVVVVVVVYTETLARVVRPTDSHTTHQPGKPILLWQVPQSTDGSLAHADEAEG